MAAMWVKPPMSKEAKARIKINKLLEDAGWRFFDDEEGPANILLENYVKITQKDIDAWGNDYEKIKGGSLDFLLVDSNNKPFCVLEAKKESLHPLVAKEQARKYANTVGAQREALNYSQIKQLTIPLPPLETQRQIVFQIEKEQALVNASKQLIEIFEKKIKDRIAKIWGADKNAPVIYGENDILTMAAEE
jgi:type I site-specific restriction endonuclease